MDTVKEKIQGKYLYHPAVGGEPELRALIADVENQYATRSLLPENIILTDGGYAGLFTVLRFIVEYEDEVVTNTISYEGFTTILQDTKAIHIRTDLHNEDSVKSTITNKTKAILINSPENPTGIVYNAQELNALVEIAEQNDLWLILDEVTNRIVYPPHTWYGPDVTYDKLVIINSFSKNWFISGISAGWIATKNETLLKKLTTSPYAESTGIDLLTQLLLIEILQNVDYETFIKTRLSDLSKRRQTMADALTTNQLTPITPSGGMNFYVDMHVDTEQLFDKAMEHAVAFIPGRYFEETSSTFARLGFGAVTPDEIVRGISMLVGL